MYDTTAGRAVALDWRRRQRGSAEAAYLYTHEAGTETLVGQLAGGFDWSPGENARALLTVSEAARLIDDSTLERADYDSVTHVGVVFGDSRPSTLFRVPEQGKRPSEVGSDRTWRFDLEYVGPFTPPVAALSLLTEAGAELLTEAGEPLQVEAA